MYKILFNLHTDSEKELLLFTQKFHRSETLRGFWTCPMSISTNHRDQIQTQNS